MKHLIIFTVLIVCMVLVVVYGVEPALKAPGKAKGGNPISALLIGGF